MQDQRILEIINHLVAEEHALLEKAEGKSLNSDDHQRLDDVQVTLDQCWDLLRQRRARREFKQDPDAAQPRDAATVERYVQ